MGQGGSAQQAGVKVRSLASTEVKKNLTGKLIVGASTIPGVYLMPRMMTKFQKKYFLTRFARLRVCSTVISTEMNKLQSDWCETPAILY